MAGNRVIIPQSVGFTWAADIICLHRSRGTRALSCLLKNCEQH